MIKLVNHYSFNVKEPFMRLDQFLVNKLPHYSRSKIKNYIKMGQVTIEGVSVKPSMILKGNETVVCRFKPEAKNESLIPEKINLNIIFEDKYIVVINKEPGMVVHPGNGNRTGTLLNGLLYHFNNLSRKKTLRPGLVHRLDKETSGVIIIAKDDKIHDDISLQFSERKVKKEYMALVWGKIPSKGEIKGEIGRHAKKRQIFSMVHNGGRESYTKFILDDYLPPLSLVNLFPETGRTHQLRVHLQSIGHPIFGDVSYGGGKNNIKSFHVKYTKIINNLLKKLPRVALHAMKVKIIHPVTLKEVEFSASIPKDFNNAINLLKNE